MNQLRSVKWFAGQDVPGFVHRSAMRASGFSRMAFEEAYEAQRRGTFPSTFVIEAVTQSVTDDTLAPKGLHTMTLVPSTP